jgi:hypothetical protein
LKLSGDAKGAAEAFRKYIEMERRPEEQRWVDKARIELQALEEMVGPKGARATPGDPLHATNQRLSRELALESAIHDDDALVDPFTSMPLKTGLHVRPGLDDGLIDPFGGDPPIATVASPVAQAQRIGQYGAALLAYRRALVRQVEDVSFLLERGMEFVLAENAAEAAKIWNDVPLGDLRVTQARRLVEQARGPFSRTPRNPTATAERRKPK